jgi:glycerol kinase
LLTGSEEILVGEIVKSLAELKDQFVGVACAGMAGDQQAALFGQEDENGKEEGRVSNSLEWVAKGRSIGWNRV